MAEDSVSGAVITHPVNFSPAQLDELKRAAYAAGFKEVQLSTDAEIPLRLSHSSGVCAPIPLTRHLFNQLIINDIEKATQKIKELIAHIPANDKPEMLLLVGGSCQIPLIKTTLETACGLPAYDWDYSREAVGLGAALWGQPLPHPPQHPKL